MSEYEQLAVRLALPGSGAAALTALRREWESERARSQLFDTRKLVWHLERLLSMAWDVFVSSGALRPAHIARTEQAAF